MHKLTLMTAAVLFSASAVAGNPAIHVGDQQLLGTGASGADLYQHQGVDPRQVIAAIGSGATSGGRSGSASGSGGGRKGGSR